MRRASQLSPSIMRFRQPPSNAEGGGKRTVKTQGYEVVIVRRILRYAVTLPNESKRAARIAPFEGSDKVFFRQIVVAGSHRMLL